MELSTSNFVPIAVLHFSEKCFASNVDELLQLTVAQIRDDKKEQRNCHALYEKRNDGGQDNTCEVWFPKLTCPETYDLSQMTHSLQLPSTYHYILKFNEIEISGKQKFRYRPHFPTCDITYCRHYFDFGPDFLHVGAKGVCSSWGIPTMNSAVPISALTLRIDKFPNHVNQCATVKAVFVRHNLNICKYRFMHKASVESDSFEFDIDCANVKPSRTVDVYEWYFTFKHDKEALGYEPVYRVAFRCGDDDDFLMDIETEDNVSFIQYFNVFVMLSMYYRFQYITQKRQIYPIMENEDRFLQSEYAKGLNERHLQLFHWKRYHKSSHLLSSFAEYKPVTQLIKFMGVKTFYEKQKISIPKNIGSMYNFNKTHYLKIGTVEELQKYCIERKNQEVDRKYLDYQSQDNKPDADDSDSNDMTGDRVEVLSCDNIYDVDTIMFPSDNIYDVDTIMFPSDAERKNNDDNQIDGNVTFSGCVEKINQI